MRKILSKISSTRLLLVLSLVIFTALFNSCADDFYEKNKPSWLGDNIYDQLKVGYKDDKGTNHTFTNFVRLIDDIGYAEVLKGTGSKTLFVSDDEAFARFYSSNTWGVKSYDGLSLAQKKLLLNSSMINNAYLIELMSSTEGPNEGQALRHATAAAIIDTIGFEKPVDIPENNSSWDFCRDKGILLVKDNSPAPMLHFLQKQMDSKGISNDDFSFIFKGVNRVNNDAYIYSDKVIVRDITCKNGYINILQDVLITPSNMAETIRTTPEIKIFSKILERFSAPYRNLDLEKEYKLIRPDFTDSIFTKKYFAERSFNGPNLYKPRLKTPEVGVLEFDPGWNSYTTNGGTLETDMAAIFAPKDDVINDFFYNGGGRFLIEKYGSIEKIPNDKLDDLLRNLMKPSFIGATPSRFSEVLDDGKEPMGIVKNDVAKTLVTNNGTVYITNKVYPPASYSAVTAPTLVNDWTKIFAWAVANCPTSTSNYNAYLLSMDSRYSFIVPWDLSPVNDKMGKGMYYIDPVSMSKVTAEIFKFWYNTKSNAVAATAYSYDVTTGVIGDSIRPVSDLEIKNRLEDMLDYHIVVGNIEDGKKFYRTKGGGEIEISGNGLNSMQILGSGNIEKSIENKVTKIYDQTKETNGRGNGKTYITNSPLLPSYKSVYKILSEEPEFSEFFKLLLGNSQGSLAEHDKYDIFYQDKLKKGLDFNIKFFNTYHYTVYVPTNDAVKDAIAKGLPTWEIINQQTDQDKKDSLASELTNFLRYHFQDNSVYIDGSSAGTGAYETAAFSLSGARKYYKLYTKLSSDNLIVAPNPTDLGSSAAPKVTSSPALRNIMAREYSFNNSDPKNATQIETSSYAVIHQIDKVLLYRPDLIKNMKRQATKTFAKNKISYNKSTAK